jgi:hypothetical protein
MTSQSALSYEEPGIRTILIQSGFLLVLNFANSILDRLVYCGLIGQIFIGVAWGMPGARWLTLEAQEMMQQLGYLGLLLLVYEGNIIFRVSSLLAIVCDMTVMSIVSCMPQNLVVMASSLQAVNIFHHPWIAYIKIIYFPYEP